MQAHPARAIDGMMGLRARPTGPMNQRASCTRSLTISPGSGNRPVSYLLKTLLFPSTTTSKMPLLPATRLASMLSAFFNSAARLAARGS